ncbi:SOS response-associated peptidase [Bacillus pinisoli]|uniref:SOS response-associated peptidase n=1 Tax=Bacillus pinisoli TaxID=2901866 RepID=UPI001FF443A6|nr:SOS response-associated peptidase [Bacillus pinisoli]
MCGRFTLFEDLHKILKRFEINLSIEEELYTQRYNIAPTQSVLSVINDGKKNRLGYLRWGLIPPWAKDEKVGSKLINARAETLAEKPSFKKAYSHKRCLVIANSFYEWKKVNGKKTPICIKLKNNELFAMAGLWESWISPTGQKIHSCSIITTTPNELMSNIHDRMPVILPPEQENIWLDRNITDYNTLNHMLKPLESKLMEAYEVSTLVNSPKNNTPELIQAIC